MGVNNYIQTVDMREIVCVYILIHQKEGGPMDCDGGRLWYNSGKTIDTWYPLVGEIDPRVDLRDLIL